MSFFGRKEREAPEQTIRVEGSVRWEVMYDVAAKMYVGICHDLNLNAAGATWIEFQEVASETMAALFVDIAHHGELEEFARTHGWRFSALPRPGVRPRFDIPFEPRLVPELTAAYA